MTGLWSEVETWGADERLVYNGSRNRLMNMTE